MKFVFGQFDSGWIILFPITCKIIHYIIIMITIIIIFTCTVLQYDVFVKSPTNGLEKARKTVAVLLFAVEVRTNYPCKMIV